MKEESAIIKEIILILGLIIGIILLVINKKKQNQKYLKRIGIGVIVVCVGISIPDMINGFVTGFMDGLNSY